ncbi:hypothetical protein [Bifidobacterium simiarum]|uniref:hypothetical protein n=1 Tax=Bifidobacterium simiarum TaxID=2045441 RepID=UPI001BDD202F|nr:hypothetical protein [Bifidobacterium simiarum]MBT1165511.1 hypothetical protein [Bifidobacterium simiarum]
MGREQGPMLCLRQVLKIVADRDGLRWIFGDYATESIGAVGYRWIALHFRDYATQSTGFPWISMERTAKFTILRSDPSPIDDRDFEKVGIMRFCMCDDQNRVGLRRI